MLCCQKSLCALHVQCVPLLSRGISFLCCHVDITLTGEISIMLSHPVDTWRLCTFIQCVKIISRLSNLTLASV